MRNVDPSFTTHFITHVGSGITTVSDLKGNRVALGSRSSVQARLLPCYFLQQQELANSRLSGCLIASPSREARRKGFAMGAAVLASIRALFEATYFAGLCEAGVPEE
jgi:ABC-type phosphate/phosphonate transport system substrate-binding protein